MKEQGIRCAELHGQRSNLRPQHWINADFCSRWHRERTQVTAINSLFSLYFSKIAQSSFPVYVGPSDVPSVGNEIKQANTSPDCILYTYISFYTIYKTVIRCFCVSSRYSFKNTREKNCTVL